MAFMLLKFLLELLPYVRRTGWTCFVGKDMLLAVSFMTVQLRIAVFAFNDPHSALSILLPRVFELFPNDSFCLSCDSHHDHRLRIRSK